MLCLLGNGLACCCLHKVLAFIFFFFFYLNHKEKPTRALCFQRCFIGLIFLNSTSLYLLDCICCSLQKIFCEHLESLMVPCTFLTLFLLHFFFFFCRFLTLGLQSAMVCPIPMTSAWTACVARLPTFLQSASRRKTGVSTPNMMCTGQ